MKTRNRKRLLVVPIMFVAGAFIGVSAGTAFADTDSIWAYYTTNGITYKNRASMSSGGGLTARVRAQTDPTQSVPAGYIGLLPRMYYQSNNALCRQNSDYTYTDSSMVGMDIGTSGGGCGAGLAFYSYGLTAAWNSSNSSYVPYYTAKSPAMNQ